MTNLVAVDYVLKTEVDKKKGQNKWSQEEICDTKKNKEKNSRDVFLVRNSWNFWFNIRVSTERFCYKTANKREEVDKFR